MKKRYKILVTATAVILGVMAMASVLYASQPHWCCKWDGDGFGHVEVDDEDYYFFQYWYANTAYINSSYDTVIGCWYDDYGHGGPFYGRRYHTTDSASGKAYASGCPDPNSEPWGAGVCDAHCDDHITGPVLARNIYASWSGAWTGCCDENNPNVQMTWQATAGGGSYNGGFSDNNYRCVEVSPPDVFE